MFSFICFKPCSHCFFSSAWLRWNSFCHVLLHLLQTLLPLLLQLCLAPVELLLPCSPSSASNLAPTASSALPGSGGTPSAMFSFICFKPCSHCFFSSAWLRWN